ncbi:glucose dehydrogenase [Sphingomonas sp. F9_3S_D5_B_2]
MHRQGFWIRVVYALCLAGACVNHVRALLVYGWWREGVPLGTTIYWDSLTLLDPLAALLLFVRPRAGVALTIAIIVSDVAHNVWFEASHALGRSLIEDLTSSFVIMSQVGFLLFVAITAPTAWRQTEEFAPIS